ncbi:DUF1631 family protein [Marinobacteraceae bacterium S3BR75-40.1]
MTAIERREYARHELRHDALIVARDFYPAACEVANLCDGGMWLDHITSKKLLGYLADHPGARVEVHLFVDRPGREIHSRVLADVRRIGAQGIGVEFVEPMPDLTALMLDVEAQSRHRRVLMADDARQKLRQILRDETVRFLHPLLDAFVEEALETIQRRLEKAGHLQEINRLKDTRLLLVEGRESFQGAFFGCWQTLRDLAQGNTAGRRPEDLRIVDKAQFEDWLELQMVATTLANHHRDLLFRLNQLMAQLSHHDLDDRNNPLAPIPLCQCLQYATHRMGFEAGITPLLYQAYENALEKLWPQAIAQLIERLETAGLRALSLEKMPRHWSAPAQRARRRQSTTDDTVPGDSETVVSEPQQVPKRVSGSLLRLVGLHRDPRNLEAPEPSNREALLNELRPQRERIREALGSTENASLVNVLGRLTRESPELARQVQAQTWDLAQLVDQIFQPLDSQKQLQPELRHMLDQLRLPVLQLLLDDPGFLEDDAHPARQLINHLMRLCLADRGSSKNLERTVGDVVEQLMSADVLEPALLQRLGERLEKLVERQDQAFLRNAERIAKSFEGRQKLHQARRAVQRRVHMRLAGREVPLILLDLLAAGWEQLMVLALLKEGGDSVRVAELFNVIEQLQAWLGREGDTEDMAFERELESPALLELIERELVATGEPGRYREVLKRLRSQLMDEERPEHVWLAHYPLGETLEEEPRPPEPEDNRWTARAHQLHTGDWVAVYDAQGEAQRMRLVWVGDDAYRFVFLTPKGLHEVEYDFNDLVDRLAQGEIQRVERDQVPFVDQSLYDIVQDLYREMAFRSSHDPLTGCLQRHAFEKELDRLLLKAQARGERGALIILDIDQFSVVNASYGTGAGDQMLRELGVLLGQWCPQLEGDRVMGRLGSNEFGLALMPLGEEDMLDLAERLGRQFRGHAFRHQGVEFTTTLSVGTVALDEASPAVSMLLNEAYLALKGAKQAGGDRVRRAEAGQHQHQQEVLSWVARIDRALAEDTLTLRAQKIVPVDGDAAGHCCEILLGVNDDDGNPVSPQAFIEAAERYKRSNRVDRWVVDRTLTWMMDNPKAVTKLDWLTINLSGTSLSDDEFLGFLEQRLRGCPELARKICFEVTETAAVANLHYTADFMREMKQLGCRFALDDFGTGLSSYAYLQRLPVDLVKIDGVFVKDLASNLTNYAMVRSITELSHFLGIETVAEFVEDLDTLEALREIDVDYAQGYGISPPRALASLFGES